MKLTDLHPYFLGNGGEGVSDADGSPVPYREGVALGCDCPCGACGQDLCIPFKNPIGGGPPIYPDGASWQRTGETFETLTLTPSILRNRDKGGCGWHGFITNGEIIAA